MPMPAKKQVTISAFGVVKKVSLPYIERKTPFGTFKLLDAKGMDIPKMELIRIAGSENIPIDSDYGIIFPEGKTAMDFIKKRGKSKR